MSLSLLLLFVASGVALLQDQQHWWLLQTPPVTPCPAVFSYQQEAEQWVGLVVAPPPRPTDNILTLNLTVTLTVSALLQTNKFVGRVELREDKGVVASRLREGNSSPVQYRVWFPLQSPLPHIIAVQLNDRVLCQQQLPDSKLTARTTLTLSHTLHVNGIPTNIQTSLTTRPPFRPQTPWILTTSRPPVTKPPRPPQFPKTTTEKPLPPPKKHIGQEGCGSPILITYLVQNGMPSQKDAWPWLAAIFKQTEIGLNFHCGGSLVSLTHVVTAAHCMGQPGEYLTPNKLLVYLGKRDMRKWTEPQSQPREVTQIVIHPGHRPDIRKEVDLAILVLAVPVVRSPSVQPICLWFPSNPSVRLDLEPGTVVGWGRDEKGNRVSDEPRQIVMPLVSQEECLRSHRDFLYLTSENTFCAGGRDGSGPCSGDSGGGMYTSEPQNDGTTRWMLRGVVSQSLLDATTHQCDLKNFVVFTDAIKHASWIRMVVENT